MCAQGREGFRGGEAWRERRSERGGGLTQEWDRVREEHETQRILVAQSWVQEEKELKEGNGGQNRGVFLERGRGLRETLRGGGHLREEKGFQREGRGLREGRGPRGG